MRILMLKQVLLMCILQALSILLKGRSKSCSQDMASFNASSWEQLCFNTVKYIIFLLDASNPKCPQIYKMFIFYNVYQYSFILWHGQRPGLSIEGGTAYFGDLEPLTLCLSRFSFLCFASLLELFPNYSSVSCTTVI